MYVCMSCEQNAGEYSNIHIGNSLSKAANLKCFVTAPTNQIYMHQQIKDRPNSGSMLPLCPESFDLRVDTENMKINTHRTVIVSVAIQGVPGGMCQTSGECSLC